MYSKMMVMCCTLLLTSGCSLIQPGEKPNWEQIASTVENLTELGARIAFQYENVKPYKDKICVTIEYLAPVLKDFDNPEATLEDLKQLAAMAIQNVPSNILDDEAKNVAVMVMNQVFDMVFNYVKDSYADLLEQDETKVVLLVSRAVSTGLERACGNGSLRSLDVVKR